MISFCAITDGKRPEKLANLLASVAAQGTEVETTVAVDTSRKGKLGALRNQAARASRGDVLVVSDDDLIFEPDFCNQLLAYPAPWNIMLPRIESPDGSRYWDWRAWYGVDHQRMWPYDYPDYGDIIPTGALVIVKRKVWERVQWSDEIGFYAEPYAEDIDWGLRLHKAGYKMTANPLCIAHHDDPRYHQLGDVVLRDR